MRAPRFKGPRCSGPTWTARSVAHRCGPILLLAAVFVLLLPILFGSVRLGLLGIVINGLPLAMTFGLMGLLGSRLNMATALIGGVAIGSTVDSTLFFINRFQAELALGRTWTEAIEAAVRGVGDGILITTGILAGGFLCMTVSSFKPTADFGIFTCFTVVTGAFLDIVIDPILLGFMAPAAGPGPAPRLTPSYLACRVEPRSCRLRRRCVGMTPDVATSAPGEFGSVDRSPIQPVNRTGPLEG